MKNPKRQRPEIREKKCTVCGIDFKYPEKGSSATRHKCASCADLNPTVAKTIKRLSERIIQLERQVATLENQTSSDHE